MYGMVSESVSFERSADPVASGANLGQWAMQPVGHSAYQESVLLEFGELEPFSIFLRLIRLRQS